MVGWWDRLITKSPDKQHWVWENASPGTGSRPPNILYWGKLKMGLWLNYLIESKYPILENHEQCTKERTLAFINDSHFLYHIQSMTYEIKIEKIILNDKNRDDVENTHR